MADERVRPADLDQHVWRNIKALSLRRKLWLECNGEFVFGEGGLALLTAIEEEGSLRAAAARVGWSYRHAWGYLKRAERRIGAPMFDAVAGKGRARGARLTSAARILRKRLTP